MAEEMINVFSDEDKRSARKEKKLLLIAWFSSLVAFLAIVGTLMGINLYRVEVFADRSTQIWMTTVSIIASSIFLCWTWFLFALKFRLTAKYVRMLRDIDVGLKDESEAKFLRFDEDVTMKDGVYFYGMEVDSKPLKREDITFRKVLIEHTLPKMDLNPGDRIKIVSHANILVSYKILERAIVDDSTEINGNLESAKTEQNNIEKIEQNNIDETK